MNNTTRTLTIAAILAATLVVGTFATTTTTTTQSAFAYSKNDNGKGNGNGNTITIQKCKQAATQSGFDNDQEQECENLICTHPGENATCTQEGAVAAAAAVAVAVTPAPIKLTCEHCFTKFLTQKQINDLIAEVITLSLPLLCEGLTSGELGEQTFITALIDVGVTADVRADLIQCLINAGIDLTPVVIG